MIRACTDADVPVIDAIINEAATAYRGHVPADCLHDPYMSRDELLREMTSGVLFSGWEENGQLLGVMGIQDVKDVSLIRHAYVRKSAQGKGIGSKLLSAVLDRDHDGDVDFSDLAGAAMIAASAIGAARRL